MFVLCYFARWPKILLTLISHQMNIQAKLKGQILTLNIVAFIGFTWSKFLLWLQSSQFFNSSQLQNSHQIQDNCKTKQNNSHTSPSHLFLKTNIGIVPFPFHTDSWYNQGKPCFGFELKVMLDLHSLDSCHV